MSYIGYEAESVYFDAHLTMLYLGHMPIGPEEQEAIVDFLNVTDAAVSESHCMRSHIDFFGANKEITVLRVSVPPVLHWLRKFLVDEFGNVSEFKAWHPHITLDFAHTDAVHLPFIIPLTNLGLYS